MKITIVATVEVDETRITKVDKVKLGLAADAGVGEVCAAKAKALVNKGKMRGASIMEAQVA